MNRAPCARHAWATRAATRRTSPWEACFIRSWTMSTPPRSAATKNLSGCSSQTRYKRARASRSCRDCTPSVWHEGHARIEAGIVSKHSSFDVAVVGGGAVGLSVAWRAAQRGLRVVVLERGEPGSGASHVAAGMLAPVTEVTLAERRVLDLGLKAAELYPQFVAELQRLSGIDPGYYD